MDEIASGAGSPPVAPSYKRPWILPRTSKLRETRNHSRTKKNI